MRAHPPIPELYGRLAPARERLRAGDDRILRTQVALSECPAPTGDEGARATLVHARFRELGLRDVTTDDVGNVCATRDGERDEAPVLVCAHLDTVFPTGTPCGVSRDCPRRN